MLLFWLEYFIIGGELIFFAACLLIVIYLIFRRINLAQKEDFEKRDN